MMHLGLILAPNAEAPGAMYFVITTYSPFVCQLVLPVRTVNNDYASLLCTCHQGVYVELGVVPVA